MSTSDVDPITDALRDASSQRGLLSSIDVSLFDNELNAQTINQSYFIASDDSVKFRHEGKKNSRPSILYLNNVSGEFLENQILVYGSSSGSGKTAELVGSSVSRNAHLAIVLSVEDPDPRLENAFLENAHQAYRSYPHHQVKETIAPISQTTPRPRGQRIDRDTFVRRHFNRQKADVSILPQLKTLLANAWDQLSPAIKVAIENDTLMKIVLAIDEGSSCPDVIRGILRYPDYLQDLVLEAIRNNDDIDYSIDGLKIKVLVSIAGTGVCSSTIGSLPDKFTIMEPSHEQGWETIVNCQLNDVPLILWVPWSDQKVAIQSVEIIEEKLPVLWMLLSNGRMASIAVSELRKYNNDIEVAQESKLVDAIIKRFMESNGMSQLVRNDGMKKNVAACALAVHLFSHMEQFKTKVPGVSEEVATFAAKMEFFDLKPSYGVTVKQLVVNYGLLHHSGAITPSHRNSFISPPLSMSVPQQLACMYMLGLGAESMLENSWFGFEQMSTHFVKCAIAASIAVPMKKRPSVQEVLELLGCKIDRIATSEGYAKRFQDMSDLKATSTFPNRGTGNIYHSKTCQMAAGLQIKDDDLIIPKLLKTALNCGTSLQDFERHIGLPVACINKGCSDLCDGIVTFWVATDSNFTEKVSIMIQAKDYHNSSLNVASLNTNSETMNHSILNGPFGERRLMCVASCHESLFASRPCSLQRSYIPYHVPSACLLNHLASRLKDQRNEAIQREEYAEKVEGVAVSGKRKREEGVA